MTTNKDYYEECREILEKIDKLLKEIKESEKFTSWNNLFDSFSQDNNLTDKDQRKLKSKIKKIKERVDNRTKGVYNKTFSLKTLQHLKELYDFMLGSLNQYTSLENRDFENKILGKELAKKIEKFAEN